MHPSNKIVHGLWIGPKLSPLELLTLHSFVQQGHHFHLWVYEELDNQLPAQVYLQDANQIIPQQQVFKKKSADPKHKIGKGSLGSPFSDLFRYKLLFEKGGWWVDMDVTCLKPLDFTSPYFFRAHPSLPAIGNVMKCPKNCPLMESVYCEVEAVCDEHTREWLLPNKILNKHLMALQLQKYIHEGVSNEDAWEQLGALIYSKQKLPRDWYFIHWMNEEWRSQGLDKSKIYASSTLANLLDQYGISFHKVHFLAARYPWLLHHFFRTSSLYPLYRRLKYGAPIL
ncbi:MAG: glycosyltransferase [Bacteroidota bacterium]